MAEDEASAKAIPSREKVFVRIAGADSTGRFRVRAEACHLETQRVDITLRGRHGLDDVAISNRSDPVLGRLSNGAGSELPGCRVTDRCYAVRGVQDHGRHIDARVFRVAKAFVACGRTPESI